MKISFHLVCSWLIDKQAMGSFFLSFSLIFTVLYQQSKSELKYGEPDMLPTALRVKAM